jgi:hypothetical protein
MSLSGPVLFFLLFSFFIPGFAVSQVFNSIDQKDVCRFTDDLSQVPAGYRSIAERNKLAEAGYRISIQKPSTGSDESGGV